MTTRRSIWPVSALLALLVGAAALHLMTGDSLGGLHWPESSEFLALRSRRLAIACTVGASLAIAGVLLQALLRNPLASPDLLGVTSGAGVGVAAAAFVASRSGLYATASPGAQSVAAFAGALCTLGLVLAWAHRRGGIDVVSLVLVGVVIGMVCSGLTLLIHHFTAGGAATIRPWFLGSIDENAGSLTIGLCAAASAACLALALASAPSIDTATLSEDEARSLGVRLGRLRLAMFLAAGVLTTVSVLLAGPIGFIGLIVPHGVRMVLGPHHRPLLIGSAIVGAAALTLADALVNAISLPTGRLPVGVVTAVAGGPLFLLLLRSTLRGRSL